MLYFETSLSFLLYTDAGMVSVSEASALISAKKCDFAPVASVSAKLNPYPP